MHRSRRGRRQFVRATGPDPMPDPNESDQSGDRVTLDWPNEEEHRAMSDRVMRAVLGEATAERSEVGA
ncbi:hypothetical protein GCM10010430_53250 [Kitasatospora cystarginea]|uniref:Uncharacterized protein n=1 Tax=Kitasatospora cystarginea TaxID=58350 RepID=A0ABP5RIN8_9ACTN